MVTPFFHNPCLLLSLSTQCVDHPVTLDSKVFESNMYHTILYHYYQKSLFQLVLLLVNKL